jgi:copper ion binding protein
MSNVTFEVPNISCGHCVHTIKTELGELAGVKMVEASQDTRQVKVEFDDPADEEQLVALLNEINYPPKV